MSLGCLGFTVWDRALVFGFKVPCWHRALGWMWVTAPLTKSEWWAPQHIACQHWPRSQHRRVPSTDVFACALVNFVFHNELLSKAVRDWCRCGLYISFQSLLIYAMPNWIRQLWSLPFGSGTVSPQANSTQCCISFIVFCVQVMKWMKSTNTSVLNTLQSIKQSESDPLLFFFTNSIEAVQVKQTIFVIEVRRHQQWHVVIMHTSTKRWHGKVALKFWILIHCDCPAQKHNTKLWCRTHVMMRVTLPRYFWLDAFKIHNRAKTKTLRHFSLASSDHRHNSETTFSVPAENSLHTMFPPGESRRTFQCDWCL